MKWSELLHLWANDGSEDMACRLWQACYGEFDGMVCCEGSLEWTFMVNNRIKYVDDLAGNRKGCYAKLFSHRKSVVVKSINRVGSRTHGNVIRLKGEGMKLMMITNRIRDKREQH